MLLDPYDLGTRSGNVYMNKICIWLQETYGEYIQEINKMILNPKERRLACVNKENKMTFFEGRSNFQTCKGVLNHVLKSAKRTAIWGFSYSYLELKWQNSLMKWTDLLEFEVAQLEFHHLH